MNRLLRTSAIRLSLRYALLHMLIAGTGLGALYWAASHYVDTQIGTGLRHHIEKLGELYKTRGSSALTEALNAGGVTLEPENHRFTLYTDAEGSRIAGDLKGWPPAARLDGEVRNIWIEDSLIPYAMADRDGYWPSIATRLPDGGRLLVAQSVRQAEDLQEFILGTLLATLAMTVGLTLVLGWRMGRGMLTRIDQINATTREIHGGHLEQRIPASGKGDEFDELAQNLNAMLDHIDRLIHGMRQVTDNVAHDLRRPLTRLRNRLDVTLLEPRGPDAYRESLEATREDIEEILRTFNALLEIAQMESGHFRGKIAPMNLSELTEELWNIYAELFGDKGQCLNRRIEPALPIRGNRQLLAQSISNLLENAYKYAGDQAHVELQVRHDGNRIVLSVADDGPGIPRERFNEVTQRYARLDSARSTPGNGLGLSLVKAIARLHDATLILEDNAPGLRVSLVFPPGDIGT